MKTFRLTLAGFSFLYLTLFGTAHAQALDWAFNEGSTQNDGGFGLAVDSSGNIYVTGIFKGTVDFDPGVGVTTLTSAGLEDAFIQKLDALGNLVWVRQLGGSGIDGGQKAKLDRAGNLFVVGNFSGTVDLDPGAGVTNAVSHGDMDAFLVKLTSGGSFVWGKSWGSPFADGVKGLAVDSLGYVYVTGDFGGAGDFDPGAASLSLPHAGLRDVFLSRFKPDGTLSWARSAGGTGDDQAVDMAVGNHGLLFYAGRFSGSMNMDPGVTDYSISGTATVTGFVSGIDTAGIFSWAFPLGTSGSNVYPYGLEVTPSDQLLVGGGFSGTVDFDPFAGASTLSSMGAINGFIAAYSAYAMHQWVTKIESSGNGAIMDMATANGGNIAATGWYSGTADFDPGPSIAMLGSHGSIDALVAAYSSAGGFLWAGHTGGLAGDQPKAVATSNDGSIMVTGTMSNISDLDPSSGVDNHSSAGGFDMFLFKAKPCTITFGIIGANVCDSYVCPSGKVLTSSGVYADTLLNAEGCDSVITIHLTVRHSTSLNFCPVACDSFTLNGITYTVSGAYSQTFTNSVGCDSTIGMGITILHSGFDTLWVADCDPVTINGVTYSASGTYSQMLTTTRGCDSSLTINFTLESGTTSSLSVSACGSYTLNGITYSSAGSYTQTLLNVAGCDSLLTLDLDLTVVDTSVLILGDTAAVATASFATYQWLDCATGSLIPGATAATFDPIADGLYAVIVTQGGCSDTSACIPLLLLNAKGLTPSSKVTLSPNPSAGMAMLNLGAVHSHAEVRILDLQGRIMQTLKAEQTDRMPVQLPSSPGLYILEVNRAGQPPAQLRAIRL